MSPPAKEKETQGIFRPCRVLENTFQAITSLWAPPLLSDLEEESLQMWHLSNNRPLSRSNTNQLLAVVSGPVQTQPESILCTASGEGISPGAPGKELQKEPEADHRFWSPEVLELELSRIRSPLYSN